MNILSDKGNPPEMFLAELMKRHRVAGAAFALIRSGELAHTGFCGVADPEEDRPVDASTHFEIASLTKTVFARCILKLEDRGLLRLDRPLREYSDEPLPTDDPAFRDVTARDVLTHATGLPNWETRLSPCASYREPVSDTPARPIHFFRTSSRRLPAHGLMCSFRMKFSIPWE